MTRVQFLEFDMMVIREQLNITFILISLGEPHCHLAPTLPQWPFSRQRRDRWGIPPPFSRPKGGGFPLSFDSAQGGACSPSKGPHPAPWRDESLFDNGVHQKVREIQ